MVTGYTDDGVVVLTCEVYGYLMSDNPPVSWWRETGGPCPLLQNCTSKYTVEYSNGSRLARNPDGTTRQSIVANLTIHQLTTADNGTYICKAYGDVRTSSILTVMPGTGPTGQTLGSGATSVTGGTLVTTISGSAITIDPGLSVHEAQ